MYLLNTLSWVQVLGIDWWMKQLELLFSWAYGTEEERENIV